MELQPSDLRIGNYVLVEDKKYHSHLKDIPMKINKIAPAESIKRGEWTYSIGVEHIIKLGKNNSKDFEAWYESNREYNQFIHFIKPIPLTEQWLIDFGFELLEKSVYKIELTCANFLIINIHHKTSVIGYEYQYNGQTDQQIEYPGNVHQLQNLYFALKNKELTK